MNINIQVSIEDLIDSIHSRSEAIEIIEALEEHLCSWDFTGKLLLKLFNMFRNDFKSELSEVQLIALHDVSEIFKASLKGSQD